MLSRIQTRTWSSRRSCTILSKQQSSCFQTNFSPRIRSFKTFSAHLQAGEGKIAIDKSSLEGSYSQQTAQLYLDNVFPLKVHSFDIRQMFFRDSKSFLESKAHQAIPSDDLPYEFAIKEIIARTKDGGAIVTFTFKSTDGQKLNVAKEIVDKINHHVTTNNIVAPFNFQSVRAFLVKGQPFLEDILARYPTQRLRIEFQGPAVHVETLYHQLRPYGKLFDLAIYPNPITAKDPARYAMAYFTRMRHATSARNCLHGHVVEGTRLNVLYERQLRTNVVKDWLVNHPRITVPAVAAIFAGITYVVFDPIRVFFITSKVTQRFNPEEYALYRWLRRETWARLLPVGASRDVAMEQSQSLWADDVEKIEKLKSWLAESPETFVLITGHKGSGKSALVKSAIQDRKNKLFIDCEELATARNQSEMTKGLAKEVGYFPVFTWAASMSGMFDTMIAATTGQKTSFSSSPDSQMKDILETVAIALREIVPNEKEARRRAEENKHHVTLLSHIKHVVLDLIGKEDTPEKTRSNHPQDGEKEGDDSDELTEKLIPIVVIDNYMYRETAKNAKLWEELAEWASLLIENEIAHVVFVSSNAGVMKTLGKALPGKSFSSIALSDAPLEMAMSFIKKQLDSEIDDPELPKVVSALGGRLTELELLVQKMKMNMDAKTAFEDIVARNLIEIRKYGFGDSTECDSKLEWTAPQFWTIVKLLSEKKHINYDELKWSPVFNGSEGPLKAMERAELIIIVQKEGRSHSIRPGKPVYYTVFDRLMADTIFNASMEIESNMALKKQSEENMAKLEDNINKLTHINAPSKLPKEIEARVQFLLTKVASCQKSIEEYDTNIKKAKEIITQAWAEELSGPSQPKQEKKRGFFFF
ncbi:Mitochondrial escape protein 2 [Choanephora cucurbitarum]|uniref:Mitochondrial escape protein 2 n=1 Tax=Choanephora cucurbitarum TaxID=101091 RepID=A0A1C7NLH6_9FUNG|nr:Mitochondrial escape protein 2 [Choanephora cucurbitarum]